MLLKRMTISISETCLDLKVDDKTINKRDYNLIRTDYPNNQKRGLVCFYFKGNLYLRHINMS